MAIATAPIFQHNEMPANPSMMSLWSIIMEIPALLAIVRGWSLSIHVSREQQSTMILPFLGRNTLAAAFNFGAEVGA